MNTLHIALFTAAIALNATLAAAEVDLNIQNAAIQKLQSRINERAAKLESWKNSGVVGEAMNGLVEQRPALELGLAEKKQVHDLVVGENEDRYALFRELAAANGLQITELESVAAAFARTRRNAAAPAHWIQNSSDKSWVQKKDLHE